MGNPKDSSYIVLTADIVHSRKLADSDRAAMQKELTRTVDALNQAYADKLRTRLNITAGDSFQAVVSGPSAVPDLMWDVWSTWEGSRIRFGIGFGRIYTPFEEDSRLMDGPAFHNAVEA
jgi:hypothetical protein